MKMLPLTEVRPTQAEQLLCFGPNRFPIPQLELPPSYFGHEVKIEPVTADQLYTVNNGIDLKAEYATRFHDFAYEDACFRTIAGSMDTRNRLLIGPHLIDRVLPLGFSGPHIPDAIMFGTHQRNVWVINEMYEFKSGEKVNPYRKMDGFSELLRLMREDDTRLPNFLKNIMPWTNGLPDRIVAPPNYKVEVTFVTPKLKNGVVYNQDGPFRVGHLRVAV